VVAQRLCEFSGFLRLGSLGSVHILGKPNYDARSLIFRNQIQNVLHVGGTFPATVYLHRTREISSRIAHRHADAAIADVEAEETQG
jgi:hypothetical protein